MGLSQPGRGLTGKASHKKEHSLFLSDPSQREEVEESTSRPQLPQPDPTQEVSGPCSSSDPMLAPALEERVVFPCGEKSLSPLPKLCDRAVNQNTGPLATEGDEPLAAPLPGTGQPEAAASRPKPIQAVRE